MDQADRFHLRADQAPQRRHRLIVRQMTESRHDPSLEAPGVISEPQHVEIVVGFEQETITTFQMLEDVRINVAKVRGQSDTGAVTALDHVAGGVGCIMKRSAAVNLEIADPEAGVVLERHDAALVDIDPAGFDGSPGRVDGNPDGPRDSYRAPDV